MRDRLIALAMTDVRHCISCRMVTAVKDAAGTAPVERTDAGAVRALVDVIKKEETAVVVNLDERIQACIQLFHGNAHVFALANICQEMTLRDMPVSCYPEAEPSNKLATSRAKAIKAKVNQPSPWWTLPIFFQRPLRFVCVFF